MRRFVLMTVMALMTATFSQAADVSLAGKWSVDTSVAGTDGTSVCTFVQKGEELTGNCTGDDKVEHKLTGKMKGNKATWQYDTDYNGSPLTIVFSGTVKEDNQFSGSIDVQPMGVSGDFTAKRQK